MNTVTESRPHDIRRRRLEIAADLAASRDAWASKGIERPLRERTALEAEDAALALELHDLKSKLNTTKVVRKMIEQHSMLNHLLMILEVRGLQDIVMEASQRTAAELMAAVTSAEA